jgi:glycosyltransferase involved in cell wall biosynthesis
MKVALNCRPHDGPWGGGNRFVIAIQEALVAAGHVVTERLEPDTDAVIIVDPRARNPMVTFTAGAVLRHVAWRNPRTVVVHRINECDERKGTTGMNRRLRLANYAADHTVFIAGWLRDLQVWRREAPDSVIHNGADRRVFNATGFAPWPGDGPLRLVTHHWGAHELKGFDVYRKLDELLASRHWQDRLAFTYVGNAPTSAGLKHVRFVAPLDGEALAAELRSHHGYLTASQNEPGGMHHVEGAMCGLPLVYRRSGALPEYCGPYGIGFDGPQDIESALEQFLAQYRELVARMPAYPYDAARTTSRWLELLGDLVGRRDEIAARRRPWRDPGAFLLNQLPL